jgi:hypothetical protein
MRRKRSHAEIRMKTERKTKIDSTSMEGRGENELQKED